MDNEPAQLAHVAEDENGFQTVLAGSVLHGYNAVLDVPRVYRAIAGEEGLETAVDAATKRTPEMVLIHGPRLSGFLEPGRLTDVIESAYEATLQEQGTGLRAYQLTKNLVKTIGRQRVMKDAHNAMDAGTFFGAQTDPYMVREVATLGLITPDEALGICFAALKRGEGSKGLYNIPKIAALAANPQDMLRRIKEMALAIVDDPETGEEVVTDLAIFFSNKYDPSYDEDFSAQMMTEIKQQRGAIALLGLISSHCKDEYDRELIDEIVAEALRTFRTTLDVQERLKIAKALVPIIGDFDSGLKQDLITCYAKNDPSDFIFSWELRPETVESDDEKEQLRQSVFVAINQLEPMRVFSRINTLRDWFEEGDERLRMAVLARCEGLTGMDTAGMNSDILDFLGRQEMQDIFTRILSTNEEPAALQLTLSAAIKMFGFYEAKNMFADQIYTNPDLAIGILAKNHMMLETDEVVVGLIHMVIDHEKLYGLMGQLSHIACRLPKAEFMAILETAVVQTPQSLLEQLQTLLPLIGEESARRLANAVMRQNPALVLSSLKLLPHGTIKDANEVISFMKQDERTKLAPKYFQRIMKRLPRADDTTAFFILSQESAHVYVKLNAVIAMAEDKGTAMLKRIQGSMVTTNERMEPDSISLACLMAAETVEPETVQTADDAKKYAVIAINRRLGSTLEPAEFAALETKLGDLIPLSMYALFINGQNRSFQENGAYLREIVTQLDAGTYQAWRYGDREEYINEQIIPGINEEQYAVWQRSISTESRDVVADDAVSVARKIQEAISRGLLDNGAIENLSRFDDPIRALDEINTSLRGVGQRISEVYIMKKTGALTEEQANAEVAKLQEELQELELATSIIRLSGITADEVAAGVLFNEKGRPTKVTIQGALHAVIARFGAEALGAFGQLETMLENYRKAATTDMGNIMVCDVDDFQTTFEIGARPGGSCQHYELGQFNVGLPGYFEPGVKIIGVKNENNKLVARAVVRLAFGQNEQAVMVLEPVYMSQASNDIEAAVMAHAKKKADMMGIQLLHTEKGGRQHAELRNQRAPSLYSDVFGGIIQKGNGTIVSKQELAAVN